MVIGSHITGEHYSVSPDGKNRFFTTVLGIFCQTLLASRYENRTNLRSPKTGGGYDLYTRIQSRKVSHTLPKRLIDSVLPNLPILLFTEKSSQHRTGIGEHSPPSGFSFIRIFTTSSPAPRDGKFYGVGIRAAKEERGSAIHKLTWISAGLSTLFFQKNGKQNKSIRHSKPQSLT